MRAGDVCLDIGAEYGLYTHTLASLVGPTGVVHSFEPLPGPARLLATTLKLAGARQVQLHTVALGSQDGAGALSVPSRHGLPVHGRAFLTTGATGVGPNIEFPTARLVDVQVHTLDKVCAGKPLGRVDFIKADVEGGELAVLHGAAETIAAHHPVLLLEIEARHLAKYAVTPADITTWLAEHGYRMSVWLTGSWQHAAEVTAAHRNYLFTSPRSRRRFVP